jgi:hypothetical protein
MLHNRGIAMDLRVHRTCGHPAMLLLMTGLGLPVAAADAPGADVPGPQPLPAVVVPGTAQPAAPAQAVQDLQRQLDDLRAQVRDLRSEVVADRTAADRTAAARPALAAPADSSCTFSGYGTVEIDALGHQGHADSAEFTPLVTYAWRDEVLFTGAVVFSTTDDPALKQAYIAYTGAERMMVSAGYFPLPFGIFSEREAPDWINPLASAAPLTYDDQAGIFSGDQSDLGIQVRGVDELGGLRATAILFAVAGPTYNATDGSDDRLQFGGNSGPTRVPPTFGGRLGCFPVPGLECGLSAMAGRIANDVPAYDPGVAAAVDPGTGAVTLPVAPSGNAAHPGAVYAQDARRNFVAAALDAEFRLRGFTLRGEAIAIDWSDSAGDRVRAQGFYLEAADHLTFLPGWLAGFTPVLRAGTVWRTQPQPITDDRGNPAAVGNVRELALGVDYAFSPTARATLLTRIHDNHDLDQSALVVTVGF